uniref:ATP-binding cassette, sub-family A (ABC1), member 12 n=1 Tax=Oryzias sinensis TaxID=183150 RepID=A0A8C7XP47_9TELE
MAFFQQLKLLLWKNGLTVIRRPLWSLTLISWPILIFLIMAVTRHQFPPIVRDACYVSPRNLPSAGFFPFLQTLMCNTDSHCYNTSRLADSATSTSSRDKRSVDMPKASPFATLIQGGDFFNFAIPNNSLSDPAALVKAMESIFGSSHQGNQNSVPLMTAINSTLHEEETIDKMLETINILKRAICSLTLPMINRTPESTLTNAVVTFCETNNTMFEVSLQTLNQILTEMLLTKPEEVLSAAGMSVLLFDRLQNETSMWDSLLGLPHVLSSGSVDEALSSTEVLLTNFQRTLHVIENSFPGTNESVAALRPLLVRAINLIHYVQNWPGKDVFIPLGAIVTTANSSLLTQSAVNYVLHHIQIPLDKAIGLMLDKEVVHFYLCGNSSNPMWLAAACSTGTVDMLLSWICPEKVAKQVRWYFVFCLHQGELTCRRHESKPLMEFPFLKNSFILNKISCWSCLALKFLPEFGELIEKTEIWPEMKDYFYMMNWVLNYRPDNTTQAANCSVNMDSWAIRCDAEFEWPEFAGALKEALMSQSQEVLVNCLNGTVNLLNSELSVLENQDLFDGTDPEEADLEGLITQFLSLDSNLTLSLCHMMKHVLVIYSSSFHPEKVLHPKDAAPANQTSAYFVEAALNAAEHLDEMISSSNADPASIILEFMHELQELLFTLYRLQRIVHVLSPNGELNTTQVTDLDMATMEFLGFFTPEGLENLTQAGPNVAQDIVFQKLAQFLPSVAQKDAAQYLQDLKALQHQISSCAEGQNCLIDFTEIFSVLDQISQMMLSADDSITLHVASHNSSWQWESEEITPTFLSLLALNENDYRDSFKQTLDFIKLIMANSNISSVQDVQNALKQSNLTVEELNEIAALAGAANINDLMVNVMEIANSQECFEPQDDTKVTAQCVMGLIDGLSGFLTNLPGLSNNTQILSQIPIIVNKTVSDFIQVDFNSTSSKDFEDIFKNVLANIKVSLQMNDLNNTEIMNEIRVVEGLIQLVTNMDSFNNLNTTSTNDPFQMQKVYLELVEQYLKKLEYISHNSSASALLRPFFNITQMQVTLQLAQTNFSLLVNHKIESLMDGLQYPIDGYGLREIGFTVIEISQHLLDYIKLNLELQNSTLHFDQMFNTTLLYSTDNQIRRYLRVIEKWMKQPDVPTVLTSMLQWGNSSTSSQVTDLSVLLQTMDLFFCDNQKVYLAMIRNISQALSQVLLVPSLQCEQFMPGVLSAAQTVMQLLNTAGVPLPVFVQNDILEIVRDSVNLIFSPNTNFTSSRHTVLRLLEKADGVIQQTVPEMFSGYLLPGIRVAATYFESADKESGSDQWNQIILNEMKTVQSFLPPNSSAQAYVSVIYNVTLFISESGQGNTSLWESFESPSLETLPHIIGQLGKFLSIIWPLVMEETDVQIPVLSLEGFIHLVPVMKQISTRNADHNTWEKLDHMLTDLFSVFEKTQVWNGTQNVIPVFEKVMESVVKNMQAENGMVLNLQMAIMTLLSEIEGSLNSSHVKLSDLSDDIQFAIEQTVEAVQQANSTLDCNDVLKFWEPVGEAARFQNETLRLWCDISLQPLLEANAEAQTVYSNLDTILMSAGPMSANGAADSIVETVQSLYEVNMNRSFVMEQFITAVSDRLSVMGGQSLSSEAHSHWWSQLQGMEMQNRIFNEMEAAQSFLPPNSSAQAYVSILSDIAHFIQGNSYLVASFGNASFETLPELIGQTSKLLNKFWESFVGGPDSEEPAPSLGEFFNFVPVLEQLVTGQADQKTWFLLEQMVKNLLIHLGGIMSPNTIQNGIFVFEKNVENMVKKQQEEAALIQSLQLPLGSLMREIATTMNSSEINLFDLSETVGSAVENTMQTVRQANGTLNCNIILEAWEPLREAGGLTHDNLTLWCENSLWPVLDAFIANQTAFSSQNMSHPDINPFNLTVETNKIIKAVQSLYNVNINQAFVLEHFVKSFSNLNFGTTNQTEDTEMLMYLLKQFQDMQVQSSLSALKELSDELVSLDPELQPYIEASEKAMSLILTNYDYLLNGSSSQELFEDALTVFLTSANLTLDQILTVTLEDSEDNFISLNDLIMEALNLVLEMSLFGEDSMAYQALEELLASNDTSLLGERLVDFFVWLTSTETPDLDWFSLTLTKAYDIVRPTLSLLTKMDVRMSSCAELFEDLARNVIAMFRQFVTTSDLLPPMYNQTGVLQEEMMNNFNQGKVRHRRDVSSMAQPTLINDFGDLFRLDYPSMFRAISQSPTSSEMIETAHMLFANPDLNDVVKGATTNMSWGLNASREATIDSALGMFSFLSHPDLLTSPPMDILTNATNGLPDGIPFSSVIKNFTKTLASESPDTLIRMQQAVQTTVQLLQSHPKSSEFTQQLQQLKSQLCPLESTQSMQQVMSTLSLQPGQLCSTYLPSLEVLAKNSTSMSDLMFQAVIGEPKNYKIQAPNFTRPLDLMTVGEMLRNRAAFAQDVQQHLAINPSDLDPLMNTTLPNDNLEILSWMVNMPHCNTTSSDNTKPTDEAIQKSLCFLSFGELYQLSLLAAKHMNTEKLLYRMVLSEETQKVVGVLLKVSQVLTEMMDNVLPVVSKLQSYLSSVKDLNLGANNEFRQMTKGLRTTISSRATFVTISRALCSNGILALFGISKLHDISNPSPSFFNNIQREEMIDRFKIPRNATPFCMNMYLDMVNTTGGAIAWAFLKPMLMGQILYTPNTPETRAIMKKANATLDEFGNLRKNSEEWIKSSNNIMSYSKLLSTTLPMLQNSLSNSFVKNFIEMQTNINVDSMKETLNNFSNMTELLDNHKDVLDQITTLSTLMMQISSCVTFDRYRAYDSEEELNAVAEALAKNRDLYASVIFKSSKDSSQKRERRATASSSSLPPQMSYTIRMHMDNVMRTDKVRNPYFVKQTYISASQTMRYNRGFVYLQENIDRAIIELQSGQKITDTAVQLQPFPYPCHLRDEYLEALSFVFPLLLMIAWLLFVADFVKKLVHERELRLHEYMKMMGVNPLSHFFAWFLECTTYLLLTTLIVTLVLKFGKILPNSDAFLIFLYLCDYGLSLIAFSYMVSSFFDKTYIAGLSGSLLYILSFFPFIVVLALESELSVHVKSGLSLFSPTCFSYASQYVSRYETQGEGMQWSNSYDSPIAGDTSSFGWLCWLMLIDSTLYFIIGAYVRVVFPGKYGIPAPWYFPFKLSFWTDLCYGIRASSNGHKGRLHTNVMQIDHSFFSGEKAKGKSALSSQTGEDFSSLPVGVSLHGLTKIYGDKAAIENLNVSFYEGHVTSLLGHNGAGKTTTMSLLTGLFAPSSGSIDVYGKDMQTNIDAVRKELGVCMQYDVLFDHMTTKEHLLLYGQIKAPQWTQRELHEHVRTILNETGMYPHRHKVVGTLSGGMRRKLSISIAFIGDSRLVVLDEPTTGVDPCSRRSIWDIIIQQKKKRTIIMSTHHLDEAEVLSDRIAFLEIGGLKCCGSPFYLKEKLGQGYKLTLTKKVQNAQSDQMDSAELKAFIQSHIPEARLKDTQGGDMIYSLPPFNSKNASSYRSLLTALDANLDDLQLGSYGISDTTLEEVFLQLTNDSSVHKDGPLTVSESISDTSSISSLPSDLSDSASNFNDKSNLTSTFVVSGMALAWQQMTAILIKRFHHSRRDWKGLIAQIVLPVVFVLFAMGLSCIKNDLQHYPELKLSPELYNIGPSYSFFRNQNSSSSPLVNTMMSYPGIDNGCLEMSDKDVCTRSASSWSSRGNSSKPFTACKCNRKEQVCQKENYQPPHKKIPSSQIVYNLSGINVENYLLATANDFIRNRYGGFDLGMPLPFDLKMDVTTVPKNRTLSKVWFNPEGFHTMPAYLNSLNNLILRSSIPADKEPSKYGISVSSHPYFGRVDDEVVVVQGMIQILVAMCMLTGFSITLSSFAIYEVSEHQSGFKRLQHIAGIGEPFYWAVNFFYDMALFMVPVTLTVGVIAAFQVPAFTDRQNLAAVALLLVLFGFSTFPWMYVLAGVFRDAETAFITYVCINLFLSTNTVMSTSILYFLGQVSSTHSEVIQNAFETLSNAFLIFPQFNFGNGLMYMARVNIEVQILSGYGIDAYKNPFSTDGLGWMFISSFIIGLFFFTLRLLLNRILLRKVWRLIKGKKTSPPITLEEEDEDVAEEHLRVSSGAASSDVLQLNQLSKVYQHLKKKVHAVKRLSVGIPAGECFGLLGVNGAGKTTTFKMLTGDVSPSDGSAHIRDWDGRLVDIMECRKQGIYIGYCPQVDALDELLTGEEHLYFYARIRGIPKREIDGMVNYLLKRLELNYYRKIITDGYSCGTRRKLSTALALIGHPQILLLDEPSSGMDPRTKRHLWKIISEEVKGKSAVVLTSHSMEECEALCNRLAIMVKGQFRCLGSLQHIKNRFGSGFTVRMYLAEASCDVEAITDFMQRKFPSTYLKDQHFTMVEYHVPTAPGGVADIFNQLESNKNTLQIKHFSVSQTTLDEVFINFAMGNTDLETTPIQNDEDTKSLDSIKAVKS